MKQSATRTGRPNRPSHYLYAVAGEGEKEFWTRIGAAWPNKDGKGYSVEFVAFPAGNRRVVMRDASEADAERRTKAAA